MAIRIQLRRDTAANWTSSNPVLRAGELGIETDTLKFKIGNGSSTWTQITSYANITPTGLSNSLGSYILSADQGNAGGPAELDANGDLVVPQNSVILWNDDAHTYSTTLTATQPTADRTITFPNATGTVALTSDLPTQYTDELAQDAAAAALAAGTHTNITVTYNDAGNSISLTGAVTYTDENAQDAVGNAVGTGLSYNDTTGAISVDTSTIQARVTNVTDTEIGYLDGVTSAIQTQLDDKSTASKTETLTNKTLTTPTINGPTITATGQTPTIHGIYLPAPHNIIFEGTTADDFETTLQAGEPTADRTITLPDATGTVALVANVAALSGATFTGAVSGTDLTLSGNLTVNGTTTTLNSTTISVDDKNIELGSVENPSDATADGGGITLKGTTDKTFNWVDATDAWTSSEHVNLASGKSLYLNGTLLKDATETITNKTINANANTITVTSANVSDFNEAAQDAVGNSVGTGLTYTDSTGAISVTANTYDAYGSASTVAGNLSTHESDTTTHGTTGNIVGTSDTQTLTNKTLTSPKINEDVAVTATATELNYVDGVTSAIQTQLDGKVDESLFDTKGDLLVASADNTPAKLAVGTNGYLLTANSSATNGVEWAAAPVSLPSQTGNSGKYLTTDGSSATWGTLVVPITTGTSTVSANTATTIDETEFGTWSSIEYLVSLKQGSKVRTSKVILQTDTTNVDMTEYAITETGGTMSGVSITSALGGIGTAGALKLTVTDAATTNVTVKFSKVVL